MTGSVASDLMVFGMVGLYVVATLFALRGRRADALRPFPGGFALSRPWEQCAVGGLLAVQFLLVPLLAASDDLRVYGAVRPDHWSSLWVIAAIGLAGAAMILVGISPEELAVNEDRRTYRWSAGWPPFRRVCTGPLSDVKGVWVGPAPRGGDLVWVRGRARAWRRVVGWQIAVERFATPEAAAYYADGLADRLGVPRLPDHDPYALRLPTDWRRLVVPGEPCLPYRRARRWRQRLGR